MKEDKLSLVPNELVPEDNQYLQPEITRVIVISQVTSPHAPTNGGNSCMVMLYAVLTCVLCCWPVGIVAIVFAAKYRSALMQPTQADDARRYLRLAVNFSTLSLVLGIVLIVIYVCRIMLYNN